jgi:choline kinase
MKAVILAAGMASRLRPKTLDTPKCLLKIGNRTILERTIENLVVNSITDILIVTGFLGNKIKEFTASRFPSLKIQFIDNPLYESTNNIYSLWLTQPAFEGSGMILLDSDIVFDDRIIKKLLESEYDNCLALVRHTLAGEEIKVKMDGNSKILEIGKEVSIIEAAGESIGIELFSENMVIELFKAIHRKVSVEKRPDVFYEAAFQQLINERNSIYAVDISDYFCMEIDTPEDFETANELFPEQ